MYVSINGLAQYSDTVTDVTLPQLEGVEQRVLAYISPRMPEDTEEQTAVEMACYAQFVHEYTPEAKNTAVMAIAGLSSYSVQGFSVAFKAASANTRNLFPSGLSPTAYAYLFNANLFYRGVSVLC